MKRSDAATAFGCASVLLSYPDEGSFRDDVAAVGRALSRLPAGRARAGLGTTASRLETMTPLEAAAAYVDTFDLRRGTTLHLSYYRHGETRERGMALAALADAYRAAGFRLAAGELPDHLPALLELAAVRPAGASLLCEHRMALDALRLALEGAGSLYAPAVGAVVAALPGPAGKDRAALRRYLEQGPPSERVGLEPFAPPEVLGVRVTIR